MEKTGLGGARRPRAGLKDAAARRDLLFGTAVKGALLDSPGYRAALLRECSLLTAEYEMKWDAIAAAGYGAADRLLAFAETEGLAVHGHTLWWHESVPGDVPAEPPAFAAAARDHLATTVARYAGRVRSWDVVNEPLNLADGHPRGLRRSPFLEHLGEDYIGEAYRLAARCDPATILVLNEMGLEYAGPAADDKRRAALALLSGELARGTPIHALGIQAHLDAAEHAWSDHSGLRAFLREVTDLGLAVMITEMDVTDRASPRAISQRDAEVAAAYRRFVTLVLEECRVLSVATWGLMDSQSWLPGFRPRPDGAPMRPLLLDSAFRRKRAWAAMREALAQQPRAAEADQTSRKSS
ncbi:MAG TPA: endo-1,4-beta-xylanase [Microvirga sp.]|jgi:endo-1,4-beta-xylanase